MDSGQLTGAFNSTPSREKIEELIAAAAEGDVAAVTAFLDHHSKVPAQTIDRKSCPGGGYHPVDAAARERWKTVGKTTPGGYTALAEAANNGREEVVALLLERGADVNIKSNQDMTPLMLAARGGYIGIVEMLLKAGADITRKSKKTLRFGVRCAAENYASTAEIAKLIREFPEKEKLRLEKQWLDETDCGRGLTRPMPASRPLGLRN